MHATRDVDTSKVGAEKPAVGIKAPATFWEKVLFVLSRHRETSIAVIALILVIYFQVGSNGGFLTVQFVRVSALYHGVDVSGLGYAFGVGGVGGSRDRGASGRV